MTATWESTNRVEQIARTTAPAPGAYVTVSAFGPAGEQKIGRHEFRSPGEILRWIGATLADCGHKPGIEKVRVRFWGPGGKPGQSVTCKRLTVSGARARAPEVPASVARPGPDRSTPPAAAAMAPIAPQPCGQRTSHPLDDLPTVQNLQAANRDLNQTLDRLTANIASIGKERDALAHKLKAANREIAAANAQVARDAESLRQLRREVADLRAALALSSAPDVEVEPEEGTSEEWDVAENKEVDWWEWAGAAEE
jgi:hypothetical protein